MDLPAEGSQAPPFEAPDETGRTWRLDDLQGRWVVLFFYPKDDTPGCTKEACSFRDVHDELREAGAVVLGVSRDDAESHTRFIDKLDLNYPLLVDDGALSEAYGTWGEKHFYGKRYQGMHRVTFLIDPEGRIAKVWGRVKPKGHAQEVLTVLEEAHPNRPTSH